MSRKPAQGGAMMADKLAGIYPPQSWDGKTGYWPDSCMTKQQMEIAMNGDNAEALEQTTKPWNKQELLTPDAIKAEAETKKMLGLEQRAQERHRVRMQWYRGRFGRQIVTAAMSSLMFAAVSYVAVTYGWWEATVAGAFAIVVMVANYISGATAEPPEERS